ncbi:MAG: hypothetical protein FRX49_04439 [Trebouxia sp. A1-2]|nr:MAG: hypothetical protein FRX49_04439 [Trebouxia sp. A1-2]
MLVLGLDRIIDWGGMKGVGAMAIRRCASANEGTPQLSTLTVEGRTRRGGAAGAGGPLVLAFMPATPAGADVALCRGFFRASPYSSCRSLVICWNVGCHQSCEGLRAVFWNGRPVCLIDDHEEDLAHRQTLKETRSRETFSNIRLTQHAKGVDISRPCHFALTQQLWRHVRDGAVDPNAAAMCQDVTQQVMGSSLSGDMLISQASMSGSGQRFSASQMPL